MSQTATSSTPSIRSKLPTCSDPLTPMPTKPTRTVSIGFAPPDAGDPHQMPDVPRPFAPDPDEPAAALLDGLRAPRPGPPHTRSPAPPPRPAQRRRGPEAGAEPQEVSPAAIHVHGVRPMPKED